nr:MAG TPA: hypothetical protein [Caudoviricetes sp.]
MFIYFFRFIINIFRYKKLYHYFKEKYYGLRFWKNLYIT